VTLAGEGDSHFHFEMFCEPQQICHFNYFYVFPPYFHCSKIFDKLLFLLRLFDDQLKVLNSLGMDWKGRSGVFASMAAAV
jgi:hypothetical protein